MKIRLLIAIAGLVIGFAMPAFAQQTNTPDPQLRQQLEAFAKKEDEAFNNNDAAAVRRALHGGRGDGDEQGTHLRSRGD
jgi:hypothetical protein